MIKIAPSILSADYASLGSAVDVLADWAGMSISLMDLAAAAHRERDAGERKPSVLEQLKNQPVQERPHKTAPKKSAEKEL